MKNSDRVVCHFYRDGAERCKIVNMHLKILAAKHVETRFVSLNAPKCPFLTGTTNYLFFAIFLSSNSNVFVLQNV